MGAAVILLVLLVGSTVNAHPSGCSVSHMFEKFVHQIREFFGNEYERALGQTSSETPVCTSSTTSSMTPIYTSSTTSSTVPKSTPIYTSSTVPKSTPIYVPKSPRRPIIMVWPSVMNPAVAEAIAQQIDTTYRDREYLKIRCMEKMEEIVPLSLEEVIYALEPFEKADRAPRFWGELVPELIKWLSGKALECGFYTIFADVRQQIYYFINSNRSKWVKALQELVYSLVQVIAVIHNKTGTFARLPLYGAQYADLYADLDWLGRWVESYELWYTNYPKALGYLQKIVLNSLDIVTAWLYDYIAQRTKDSTWDLSENPAIVCALENYDMVPAMRWDYLLHKVEDKMKVMAETFVTCEVKSGCVYEIPIEIYIGNNGRYPTLRIPRPLDCVLNCSDIPDVPDVPVVQDDPTAYKYYAYAHAYMTTQVGHDLHCIINSTFILGNEVRTACHPQVVEKYITDRQYNICKSSGCTRLCCKPLPLRSPRHPHCEIVTNKLSIMDRHFTNKTKIVLTKRYPPIQ